MTHSTLKSDYNHNTMNSTKVAANSAAKMLLGEKFTKFCEHEMKKALWDTLSEEKMTRLYSQGTETNVDTSAWNGVAIYVIREVFTELKSKFVISEDAVKANEELEKLLDLMEDEDRKSFNDSDSMSDTTSLNSEYAISEVLFEKIITRR